MRQLCPRDVSFTLRPDDITIQHRGEKEGRREREGKGGGEVFFYILHLELSEDLCHHKYTSSAFAPVLSQAPPTQAF